jgi:hypothetical protein
LRANRRGHRLASIVLVRRTAIVASLVITAVTACKGEPDSTPFCSDVTAGEAEAPAGDLTYHGHIRPILEAACVDCHVEGGMAPFALDTYERVFQNAEPMKDAVRSRSMPPWLAARCCAEYHADWSLTDEEIAMISEWVQRGSPEGDPETAAEIPPPRFGLSRVDATVTMREAYTPEPPDGRTDDVRCFVADWPFADPVFVTGMNPVPGNRSIVHHLVVAAIWGDDLDRVREMDEADDRPGFECQGGFFGGLKNVRLIGGSLVGSDFPGGIGRRVEGGSKIVLNIHYSTARAEAAPDQTAIEFKVDAEAHEAKAFAVANLAWLVGGMQIAAGDPDAVFWYQYAPTLFTQGKRVKLWSVTPHMHYFGSRFVTRIVRADGTRDCLLEIPDWDFGWEQVFWLKEPKILEPGDEVYVECHFDNSAANQPDGRDPRDISWGANDQDMCAAFVYFEDAP